MIKITTSFIHAIAVIAFFSSLPIFGADETVTGNLTVTGNIDAPTATIGSITVTGDTEGVEGFYETFETNDLMVNDTFTYTGDSINFGYSGSFPTWLGCRP